MQPTDGAPFEYERPTLEQIGALFVFWRAAERSLEEIQGNVAKLGEEPEWLDVVRRLANRADA